ncbi:hypothetical protein Rhow_003232 [Rhodococcus wratislaviensis]|uniref:Uncharacterized protein n=1 Tax=Rhodococcus wratislaviensis TaxID=44752 RepID=A0A402BZ63_RHOWR|nr:hypothetical protein Rhow_003232 [Rhodococcus wratislaviensis]
MAGSGGERTGGWSWEDSSRRRAFPHPMWAGVTSSDEPPARGTHQPPNQFDRPRASGPPAGFSCVQRARESSCTGRYPVRWGRQTSLLRRTKEKAGAAGGMGPPPTRSA